MTPPSTQHTVDVGTGGKLQINIAQISQNWSAGTSFVEVSGVIENNSGSDVSHSTADITCSISGDGSFTGDKFKFDLAPGDSQVFISQYFTVSAASDGTKTVTFEVRYGTTGTAVFGDTQNTSTSLTLDRIPQQPSAPGQPHFTNQKTTSVTVSWDPPGDDGGGTISNYLLRRFDGDSTDGDYIESLSPALSRNITGLTPGADYTFVVFAINDSKQNNGVSPASVSGTLSQFGGARVRSSGPWQKAVPYVRYNGGWRETIPYVRHGGVWKQTN